MAVVDRCSNYFGPLVDKDLRTRLQAALDNPSQETWEDAYSIIVSGSTGMTMWQAILAVDPDFPRSKTMDGPWPKIPDQLTLYRAIRHATAGR